MSADLAQLPIDPILRPISGTGVPPSSVSEMYNEAPIRVRAPFTTSAGSTPADRFR
jgi:hypothetical protein